MDVFLSYSSHDQKLAEQIQILFQDADVCCFMAGKDLRAGAKWFESIESSLKECQCVVSLVTENAKHSTWMVAEAAAGSILGKLVAPATVQIAADELPDFLKVYHAKEIDLGNASTGKFVREIAATAKSIRVLREVELDVAVAESHVGGNRSTVKAMRDSVQNLSGMCSDIKELCCEKLVAVQGEVQTFGHLFGKLKEALQIIDRFDSICSGLRDAVSGTSLASSNARIRAENQIRDQCENIHEVAKEIRVLRNSLSR